MEVTRARVLAERAGGVVVLGLAFVEREAFEDERGGLLRRFVVEFDEAGEVDEEPLTVA